MYVRNRIKFNQETSFTMHGSECLWLNLIEPHTERDIVLGSIYRHPGEKVDKFIEDYSTCLEQLTNQKKLSTFFLKQ